MFTDSHVHLTAPELASQLPAVMATAQACGVRRFIVPTTSPADWQAVSDLAKRPIDGEQIHFALGVHPWFVNDLPDNWLSQLTDLLQQYPQALIGEIGLDYRKAQNHSEKQEQQHICRLQLQLAKTLNRPVILHNVAANADLLALVKTEKPTAGGIVHAFSGSLEEAKQWLKLGFFIGIGSLLLNPNAKKVRLAAQHLPLESLLLETDAPYMLPNNSNTPANLAQIAQIVCDLRQISSAKLSAQTEANVQRLLAFA
ncbi:MAG: TatD family hydrolase [Neisseria sp.]|nr:TatD family hydrolase [Neisseria sp.]